MLCYVLISVADPHHIDADPDPAFHFDADPDPDPAFSQDVKKSRVLKMSKYLANL